MQQRLCNLGYRHLSIDGVIGPQTRAALKDYQRDHDLPINGEADDATSVIPIGEGLSRFDRPLPTTAHYDDLLEAQ